MFSESSYVVSSFCCFGGLPPLYLYTAHQCRNHFVSALKMFASGKAKAKVSDKQLKRHLQDGPVCQVMDEGLYADEEGLPATQLLPQACVLWWLAPYSQVLACRLVHIYIYIYMSVYIYIYTHTYVYTCVMYNHIYTNTRTYIQQHTLTLAVSL